MSFRLVLRTLVLFYIILLSPAFAQTTLLSGGKGAGSINLGMSNVTVSFPFLNYIKGLGSFQSVAGDAFPAILNADNYPTSTPAHNIFGTVAIPTSYVGQFVYKHTGNMDTQLARGAPGFTVVSDPGGCVSGGTGFNLTIKGTCTNPRVVFTFATSTPTQIGFNFLAGGTMAGSNAILCRIADEAAIDAGGIWNPDNIAQTVQINPRSVRTLTWGDVNDGNNFARFAYRTPVTGLTYDSARWEPQAWAGTVAGTDTYTVSQPPTPVTLAQGDTVQVHWANANTVTTPTLNVGGTGAKTIVSAFGSALNAGDIPAGGNGTLVYDLILGQWIYTNTGLTSYFPIEALVSYANTTKRALWYNFPSLADDNFISSTGSYVSANLASGLAFYPEYSNEIWNFGAPFPQTFWAVKKGAALGFPVGNNEQHYGWYGLRVRQMMGLLTTAWGSRPANQLLGVMAIQLGGPTGLAGGTNVYRMQGADLSTALGYAGYNSFIGVNYNTAPNRPVDWIKIFAYAHYFSGGQSHPFDSQYTDTNSVQFNGSISGTTLTVNSVTSGAVKIGQWIAGAGITTGTLVLSGSGTTWTVSKSQSISSEAMAGNSFADLLAQSDNYNTGTPSLMTAAFNWLDTDLRSGTDSTGTAGVETLAALSGTYYPAWETIAASYTPALITRAYEGNMEAWYPAAATCTTMLLDSSYCGTTGKIANLILAYKADDRFRQLVNDAFLQFIAPTHSDTPAQLLIQGGNQWAAQPGDLYSVPYQNYNAIVNFDAGIGKTLPFLLKRDLDPAANDNAPMWLNQVG